MNKISKQWLSNKDIKTIRGDAIFNGKEVYEFVWRKKQRHIKLKDGVPVIIKIFVGDYQIECNDTASALKHLDIDYLWKPDLEKLIEIKTKEDDYERIYI